MYPAHPCLRYCAFNLLKYSLLSCLPHPISKIFPSTATRPLHRNPTMNARFSWPWGRISPSRRLEEIDRIILKHTSTMRIIETQAREAKRLHLKSIESLHRQKKMVEEFLDEDRRKSVMEQAYVLESQGIPVLDRISSAESIAEIEAILREHTPENWKESLRSPPQGPKISSAEDGNDSDLFSGGFDDSSTIFYDNQGDGQ